MKISSALLVILFLIAGSAFSQNVNGKWYGVGKVKKAGDHNSYLFEMVLKQSGRKVTGEVSYFFRSAEIKTKISGTYDASYKVLELNARPFLNYQAKNVNGADCPMEGSFTLKVTKTVATLNGQFNPTYNYRITCPAIDIKFTKSVKSKSKNPEPVDEKENIAVAAPANGQPEAAIKGDTIKREASTISPAQTLRTDTVRTASVPAIAPVINRPLSDEQKVAKALTERAFDLTPIIDVDADSLKVSLYDNGEVDNDTISLFYNRKLVATKQMLSSRSLTFTLPLDGNVNEISMFAENLGKIPPNTALAIIYAGEQRFELNLTSTYNKNATIRFRRKAKNTDAKNIN